MSTPEEIRDLKGKQSLSLYIGLPNPEKALKILNTQALKEAEAEKIRLSLNDKVGKFRWGTYK